MRAVLQRVRFARVSVEGRVAAESGPGFLVLLGISTEDTQAQADLIANKTAVLRVFEDNAGRLNRSILDTGGEALVVSNFTLYANCASGRRPDFLRAAGRAQAQPLYEHFCGVLRGQGVPVKTGVFGADMQVELCNDGPVTLVLDSDTLTHGKAS